MNTAHTPTRHYWNTGAEPSKYVFVGGAKPINAGSIERAQQICRACNAHDKLVAALQRCEAHSLALIERDLHHDFELVNLAMIRAALAKVNA